MAYKPKPGAPRTLREMFHYLWGELKSIEANGGGGGPGVTDHNDLTNVTKDQHHNQEHLLNSPDHTNVSQVNAQEGDILQYTSGLWTAVDQSAIGVTDHDFLTGVQENQHHNKVHFLVGKGPAGQHDHGDVQKDAWPNEGDILIYRGDVSTGEWKVEQLPDGGGGGAHMLYSSTHTDLFTGVPLEEGSTLMYIESLGQWAALNIFLPAAYGGINLQTPTGIADLTTNWEVIPMDTNTVSAPLQVTHDLANNGLQFSDDTVWDLSILFNLAHNESNGGREIQMRLYNVTDGTPGAQVYTFAVGRNQPGTTIAFNALVELGLTQIDKTYQLQISGGTDSFSSVVVRNAHFNVTRHGIQSAS